MQVQSNDASAREETLTDADDPIEDSGNQLAEAERAERAQHANIDFALHSQIDRHASTLAPCSIQ